MKLKWLLTLVLSVIGIGGVIGNYVVTHASDHDDGSQSTRVNNLNLTDLFVFREDNQSGNGGDSGNLVLIMDSNGHTPAGQQVFFNTGGRYDFHISRVAAANINATPTGADDVILRFEFAEPDGKQRQPIKVTAIKDGRSIQGTPSPASSDVNGPSASPSASPSPVASASPNASPSPNDNTGGIAAGQVVTTSFADSTAGNLNINKVNLDGTELTVFAGLREDPFFFDVEQFFKVRAGAAGLGPSATFRSPAEAVDGFAKQNVNSIVVRVPIQFLQSSGGGEPVFDVWETTSLR